MIAFTLPSSFCIGDLNPIPKKGKSNISCSTFRPITISAIFYKLSDLLFVDEVKEKCRVPPYQFGFQNKIGCVDALSAIANVLIETELAQEGLILAAHNIRCAFNSLVHGTTLLHTAKRGVHSRLKVHIKITNPFNLPVSDSSNHSRAPQYRLPRLSNPPKDLNSFVTIYKGARQGAITSFALFNNGVLDAQSKRISSCIETATSITLVCYADDVLKTLQAYSRTLNILN